MKKASVLDIQFMCNQISPSADVTGLNKCQACHFFIWLKFGDDVYQKLIMLQNPICNMTVFDDIIHTNVQFKAIYDSIHSSHLTIKQLVSIKQEIHPSFVMPFDSSTTADVVDEHRQIVKTLFNAVSVQFLYLNSLCGSPHILMQMVLCLDPDIEY